MKKISLIVGVLLLFAGVDLYAQFRIPFRHMNLPKRGAGHFPKGFSSSHFRDMLKREPDAAKVLDLLQQNSNLAHLQDLLQRDIILRKGSFMLKVPYSKQTWRGLQEGHTLLLPAKTAGASLQRHWELEGVKFRNTVRQTNINASEEAIDQLTYMQAVSATTRDWMSNVGEIYFTSQEDLSKALHKFYKGNAPKVIGGDGKEVLQYDLPVEGLMYEPVGREAILLRSTDYVMVYDPVSHTGQLVDKDVLHLYKPVSSEAKPKIVSYQENQRTIALARQDGSLEKRWNEQQLPRVFSSQDELGATLHRFYGTEVPQVRRRIGQPEEFYVYEIPVDGLSYQPAGRSAEIIGTDRVVIYNEKSGGQLVERSLLKENLIFEIIGE